jgi:hypothetical protein
MHSTQHLRFRAACNAKHETEVEQPVPKEKLFLRHEKLQLPHRENRAIANTLHNKIIILPLNKFTRHLDCRITK